MRSTEKWRTPTPVKGAAILEKERFLMQKKFLMFFLVFALVFTIAAPVLAGPSIRSIGFFTVTGAEVSGNQITIDWESTASIVNAGELRAEFFLEPEAGGPYETIEPTNPTENDAGSYYKGSFTFPIPSSLAAGNYYLTVEVDGGLGVLENQWPDIIVIPVSYFQWNINFLGVKDVTIHTYIGGVWSQLPGTYNDAHAFNADGVTSLRVAKGGMSYQVNGLAGSVFPYTLDVPVKSITVTGITAECKLSVVQSNWVYQNVDTVIDTPSVLNVFDNNNTYEIRVSKNGYHNASIPGVHAGDIVDLSSLFYKVLLPDGVTNLRISNGNWVDTTVNNDGTRNFIILMKNDSPAKLYYDFGGKSFTIDFVLDGSNPFYQWNITFPGVKGVTLRYYAGGNWYNVPGEHDDVHAFNAAGVTSISVAKGGMRVQIDGLGNVTTPHVINVPVKPLTVTGVSIACSLAIVQGDWVYNFADALVGAPNVFNVFDNNKDYEIRVRPKGYNTLSIPGKRAGDTVDLSSYFYNIEVPDGVTGIRISNTDWIDVNVWNLGGKNYITLMKNNGNAYLHYTLGGVNYTYIAFILDGCNPFYQWNLSIPGIEGATMQAYINGVWTNIPGTFDDAIAFDAAGATSIRVHKDGMSVQYDGLGSVTIRSLTIVPVKTITVTGVNTACLLAIVGSNWVYNYAAADVGVPNVFNVFDNRTYEVRVGKTGFANMSYPGIVDSLDISNLFYDVEVPSGVTINRIAAPGWTTDVNVWTSDGKNFITLMKTGASTGVKVEYTKGGIAYTLSFTLDGSPITF